VSHTLQTILWIVSFAIFVTFVISNLVTLALIAFSLFETILQKEERGELFRPALQRPLRPGISVIAAAFNEQPVIVPSVRSLLASDYDPLEVVIVDDGSTDGTLEALIEAFDLVELPVGDRFHLATKSIEQIYVSRADPRLRVVRKQNGGRSDAMNAGANLAQHELIATVDADSLLDRDALGRVVEVFSGDPDRVIAVGGTIRVANGGEIEDGVMRLPRVPVRGTQASQVGEYLRNFFAARIAWASMNGLLIISGAFGVFRRDLFMSVGGLSSATMGEDMEIVMRMHEQLRRDHPDLRIEFAADATSWTEVPSGVAPLGGQRVRWHIGLLDNLRLHTPLWRRRYGAVSLLALPYTLSFEVIAPLLQVVGYAILIVMIVFHQVAFEYATAFFVVVLLFGQLQTAGAILIEEVGFGRYRTRDLLLIGGWGFLEMFWYRPLTAIWRAWASLLWITGRRPGWGKIPRGAALAEHPGPQVLAQGEAEVSPAPLSR
jgi:cellulose synthase/poly-beta-1,6-N-acetylglucosamine synthase-like glycosyltransferase